MSTRDTTCYVVMPPPPGAMWPRKYRRVMVFFSMTDRQSTNITGRPERAPRSATPVAEWTGRVNLCMTQRNAICPCPTVLPGRPLGACRSHDMRALTGWQLRPSPLLLSMRESMAKSMLSHAWCVRGVRP